MLRLKSEHGALCRGADYSCDLARCNRWVGGIAFQIHFVINCIELLIHKEKPVSRTSESVIGLNRNIAGAEPHLYRATLMQPYLVADVFTFCAGFKTHILELHFQHLTSCTAF